MDDELIVNDIISMFLIGRELLTTHIIQTLYNILSGKISLRVDFPTILIPIFHSIDASLSAN